MARIILYNSFLLSFPIYNVFCKATDFKSYSTIKIDLGHCVFFSLMNKRFYCIPFQFRQEYLDTLYRYAKFQYECGNYSGAAEYLYFFRVLVSFDWLLVWGLFFWFVCLVLFSMKY